MLSTVVTVVAVLVIANLALELPYFAGTRAPSRTRVRWETAPVIGFLGMVVLGLAFVEATRRGRLDAWRWGMVLGIVLGA